MSYPYPCDSACLLDEINTLRSSGDFVRAASLLALKFDLLFDSYPPTTLETLLAGFPPTLIHENRHLCYVTGMLFAQTGRVQDAIKRLERARFAYTATDQQIESAVRCSLELARLYCSREQFQTAYYHLRDHVLPWLDRGRLLDPILRAQFYLRMAEITPDIGQFGDTAEYARKALALYQKYSHLSGQYFTLVRLASALIHQGDTGEAAHTITMAKECLAAGAFGPLAHARVLNLECHYHWHRGDLVTALPLAQQYLVLVDQEPTSNFRAYARMLLANLQRDCGQWGDAQQWYAATRQVVTELAYELYQPWIDAQEAWLYLVQGQHNQARLHIHASLQTADLGQSMSFQVTLAVLHLLDNEYTVAARLLTESLTFYKESGDELAACNLYLYLALAAKRQDQQTAVSAHLIQALGWLARHHLDYVPYWWHPTLLSEACAMALAENLYLDLVERIFLNHLREAGKAVLLELWQGADINAAQRAYRLLQSMGDPIAELVAHLHNGPAKTVVINLLRSGQLTVAAFPRLEQELTTAMRRPKPNPTLIAVFSLYVTGMSREEIAKQLECSLPGVRNYITVIYEHFGVTADEFKTRRARWQRLVAEVKARGLIV